MKKHGTMVHHLLVWMICLGIAGFTGCATHTHTRQPAASMDTPEHHMFSGMKLLEKDMFDDAKKSFSLALALDPDHSRAFYGMGLAQGKSGKLSDGFASMKQAVNTAGSSREKALAHTGFMRLFLLEKADKWQDKVTVHYKKAVSADTDLPDAHYYMGLAHMAADNYEPAIQEFETVLTIDQSLVDESDRKLAHCQKVLRALPGNRIGKNLAKVTKMTRAETAAIFIHELEIDKIYASHGFSSNTRETYPWDITDHPLKAAVISILDMDLAGLKPFPGNQFKPDTPVTRASFAMIIADIIATLSRDSSLRTRFIGQTSPYTDVKEDAPFFNAVMVCATQGIMGARDILSCNFDPMGAISGADALIIIRQLKQKLTLH